MKVVLILEYDGTRYRGFQWQANAPTIQGELEEALTRLTGETIRVIAASRTDSGVHAKGQVVSLRTQRRFPTQTWLRALNFYLPEDISVKAAYEVGEDFNVRRNALSREYRYYILNSPIRSPLRQRFTYLVPQLLDIEAMNRCCQAIIGEQDCAPFAPPLGGRLRGTVRTVHKAQVHRKDDLVIFQMVANSFLPHQVRRTIGGLIRVGLGRTTVEGFHQMAKSKKSGVIGPTAPAHGLCLTRVNYPSLPSLLREQENDNL